MKKKPKPPKNTVKRTVNPDPTPPPPKKKS